MTGMTKHNSKSRTKNIIHCLESRKHMTIYSTSPPTLIFTPKIMQNNAVKTKNKSRKCLITVEKLYLDKF